MRRSKGSEAPASTYNWRCELAGEVLGEGAAPSWSEAIRACERAAGWDRRVEPAPPAGCKRGAVMFVRSPDCSLHLALGWVV